MQWVVKCMEIIPRLIYNQETLVKRQFTTNIKIEINNLFNHERLTKNNMLYTWLARN